jgi:hypothetical protein
LISIIKSIDFKFSSPAIERPGKQDICCVRRFPQFVKSTGSGGFLRAEPQLIFDSSVFELS